jgi:hypothetical protein
MANAASRGGRTGGKPTGRTRAPRNGQSPWDVVPGTKADERLGPFFAVVFFAGVGTYLNHNYDGTNAAGLVVFYFFVLAATMGWLAWRVSHGREDVIRVHLGFTVGAAIASLAGWTVNGWTHPWADIYFFIGLPLAGSWMLYTTNAVRGVGDDWHNQQGGLDELVKNAAAVKPRLVSESPDGVRKEWEVTHRGATTADLQNIGDTLASHAGTPLGSFRFNRTGDAGRSGLTTVAVDLLKNKIPYPGPSLPGGSCFYPSRVGLREDGTYLEITRPGDPETGRPNLRIMISGMPNAGKTVGELCEVAELCTRNDVVIWWVDVIKPWQTLPAIRPAVDWAVDNEADALTLATALKNIIRGRAKLLGELGYAQWVPECWTKHGIPFLVIHFEEVAQVMDELATFLTRAAESVRSAGISVSFSLQRASYRNIDTNLRSQLGVKWSFGQADDTDSGMALSESTIANGAAPEQWTDKKPGYSYLEQPFDNETLWATPGRTYDITASDLFHVVREWAPRMTRLDPGTAADAGPAYAAREQVDMSQWIAERTAVLAGTVRVPLTAPGGAAMILNGAGTPVPEHDQMPAVIGAAVSVTAAVPVPDDEDEEGPSMFDLSRLIRGHHKGEVPEIPPEVDAGDELAPAPDMEWGTADDGTVTPEQRAEAFRALLQRLYDTNMRKVTLPDLCELWAEEPESTGKPPWVYWRVSEIHRQGLVSFETDAAGNRIRPYTLLLSAGIGGSDLVIPEREEFDPEGPEEDGDEVD